MYKLAKKGDTIPEHTHDRSSVHLTIVARGRALHKTEKEITEACSGTLLLVSDDNITHEIEALEDDTVIITVLKYAFKPKEVVVI